MVRATYLYQAYSTEYCGPPLESTGTVDSLLASSSRDQPMKEMPPIDLYRYGLLHQQSKKIYYE